MCTNKNFKCLLPSCAILLVCLFLVCSCRKIVEVHPPIESLTAGDVYGNDATAAAVLTGMYINMSAPGIFTGKSSITFAAGLSADELVPVTPQTDILTALYSNSLNKEDNGIWLNLYAYVFKANAAIEGLSSSKTLSPSVKSQLLGEAKFLRAFYYFYLVNLYGDVPLLLSTNLKSNTNPSRTAKAEVYNQIVQDLGEASDEMNENYVGADAVTATTDRVRPNKSTARALLSRVYLYTEQWQNAELTSSALIDDSTTYKLESFDDCFLITSREAICQLQPVTVGFSNTTDGLTFILASNGFTSGPDPSNRPVFLNSELYHSFEAGDERKNHWIDSVDVDGTVYPYVFKYKQFEPSSPRTENLTVFRLAEQYLIRAEARARQGKINGNSSAEDDLNVIRSRAGLSNISIDDINGALSAVVDERRHELFTEWGHRWFDIKRTDLANEVMQHAAILKGSTWEPFKALYPIPVTEITRNPNLKGHQNPGYPEQ